MGTSRVDINKYGVTQEILTNARLCTPNLRSSELLIHIFSVHSESGYTNIPHVLLIVFISLSSEDRILQSAAVLAKTT